MGWAPKRKRSYSNHPFSGVYSLLVSGRVTKHDTLPTVVNCRWHFFVAFAARRERQLVRPGWRFSWRQLWYCVQSPSKPVCMQVGSTKSGRCWQTNPHSLMDKWLHQLTNLTWQCFKMCFQYVFFWLSASKHAATGVCLSILWCVCWFGTYSIYIYPYWSLRFCLVENSVISPVSHRFGTSKGLVPCYKSGNDRSSWTWNTKYPVTLNICNAHYLIPFSIKTIHS